MLILKNIRAWQQWENTCARHVIADLSLNAVARSINISMINSPRQLIISYAGNEKACNKAQFDHD